MQLRLNYDITTYNLFTSILTTTDSTSDDLISMNTMKQRIVCCTPSVITVVYMICLSKPWKFLTSLLLGPCLSNRHLEMYLYDISHGVKISNILACNIFWHVWLKQNFNCDQSTNGARTESNLSQLPSILPIGTIPPATFDPGVSEPDKNL